MPSHEISATKLKRSSWIQKLRGHTPRSDHITQRASQVHRRIPTLGHSSLSNTCTVTSKFTTHAIESAQKKNKNKTEISQHESIFSTASWFNQKSQEVWKVQSLTEPGLLANSVDLHFSWTAARSILWFLHRPACPMQTKLSTSNWTTFKHHYRRVPVLELGFR